MLLQVNSTLFFQIVNFLVLIWILNRILFRPFLDLVQRRKEETEGTRKKGEDIADHAEYLKGTYHANVAEATAAAAAISEVQRKEGRGESERDALYQHCLLQPREDPWLFSHSQLHHSPHILENDNKQLS